MFDSNARAAAIALILLGLTWPRPAWAGAWTLQQGQLWVKQSFSYWQTTERFASTDDRALNFP
ncbi:MAG: hypothetical protein AAFV29_10240, partial [Myxococcota bacterium]